MFLVEIGQESILSGSACCRVDAVQFAKTQHRGQSTGWQNFDGQDELPLEGLGDLLDEVNDSWPGEETASLPCGRKFWRMPSAVTCWANRRRSSTAYIRRIVEEADLAEPTEASLASVSLADDARVLAARRRLFDWSLGAAGVGGDNRVVLTTHFNQYRPPESLVIQW
jgi:hypothetical protein